MRTTVRLDDGLMGDLREYAAKHGKTLTAVIEESLRETLSRSRKKSPPAKRIRLTTVAGGRLLPGVDLDDTASLLDRLDESDAAD